jgi:hypothetical protein
MNTEQLILDTIKLLGPVTPLKVCREIGIEFEDLRPILTSLKDDGKIYFGTKKVNGSPKTGWSVYE